MELSLSVTIDDPTEGNTIQVEIRDANREKFDNLPVGRHVYVYGYRFSAKSDEPADWLDEAFASIKESIRDGWYTFE